MLQKLSLVFIGGGLGAVVRWQLSAVILHRTADWRFPVGTFVVNVVGCLIAGMIAGLVLKRDLFSDETRLFLFTGVFGGFTTFSAFGLETVGLFRRQEYHVAMAYVAASFLCGVMGLWGTLWLVPEGK